MGLVDPSLARFEPHPVALRPNPNQEHPARTSNLAAILRSIHPHADSVGLSVRLDLMGLTIDDEPEPHAHPPRIVPFGRRVTRRRAEVSQARRSGLKPGDRSRPGPPPRRPRVLPRVRGSEVVPQPEGPRPSWSTTPRAGSGAPTATTDGRGGSWECRGPRTRRRCSACGPPLRLSSNRARSASLL